MSRERKGKTPGDSVSDSVMDEKWRELNAMPKARLAEALLLKERIHFILNRIGFAEEVKERFLSAFDTEAADKQRRVAVYDTSRERVKGLENIVFLSRELKKRRDAGADAAANHLAVALGNFLADQVTDTATGPKCLNDLSDIIRGKKRTAGKAGLEANRGVVWMAFCKCFVRLRRLPSIRELRQETFKNRRFSPMESSARKNFAEYKAQLGLHGLPSPD
jgi:hypothetical protein